MAIRSRLPGTGPASTTHPVPLPADRRNGDRVVVGFVNDQASTTAAASAGWDSDPSWTLGEGTSTNLRLTVFTRVLDGSAADVLTVTLSDTTGRDPNQEAAWDAVCMEGAGALPATQGRLTSGGGGTGGTGTATVTAITGLTSGDYDSLIFLGLDNSDNETHTVSPPAGWEDITPAADAGAVIAWEMQRSATGVTGFSPGSIGFTNQEQWLTAHVVIAAVPVPPAQTITPPAIDPPALPPEPTVVRGFRIRPDAIPAPVLPSPTIHPGPVLVQQTGTIPPPSAPPSPMVKHVIRPAFVTSGSAVFEPTVAAGIRPPLRIDFWAVDDDGSLLAPLPKPLAWDLSIVPGEKGAITLEYPRDGINFDVLDQRVTRARDLRIRIRTDGVASTALSGILSARDGDEVAESASVQFYGAFLPALLDEAPLPYNTDDERGESTFVDGTAGSILRDVLAIVQADGYLAGLTFTFTDTHDSNGIPWLTQTSAKFSPGRTVLQIAQQLKAWWMLEFEVVDTAAGALELRAFDPSAVGTDHTLSDPPIVFRAGRDLLESPHRVDVSQAVTSLLVAGDDGVYVEVDDPTAIAERGRKIGRYISEGNLTTEGAAQAYGLIELARSTHGADEITHALTFDQNQPAPIRELLPLDWVYSDRRGGLERLRIGQVTVSQRAGTDHYSGAVVLGDLIDSRDVAFQRALDGLAGGQIITGTSQPAPDTDDGKAPAQVQGVAVTSGVYFEQDQAAAAVTATWLEVDENFDGSPASDISRYEIQYRYSSGNPNLPPGWFVVPSVTDLDASWEGVVTGEAIEVRVRAVDRWGHVGAWSVLEPHVTASDATPPPVPSTPVAASYLGVFTTTWDGRGSVGEEQPTDFSHVEIHASQTSDFTPDRPLNPDGSLDEAASTTYLDRLAGAGTMPSTQGDYGQTWFVKLVAVDRSYNASAASAQASATLEQAGDGDIDNVSIGKLTAGIMSAFMTISGIIRTATEGARVELDTAGLRCYSSTDELLFNFSIPQSLLTIVGRVIAGAGVGSGSTVVIDPTSPPAIRMYPTATQDRFELIARTTTRPGGTNAAGFELRGLNSSGQPNGMSLEAWSTNVWLSQKNTSGAVQGGHLILQQTGEVFIQSSPDTATRARFVLDNDNALVDAAGNFTIENGAGTTIRSAGGDLYLTNASGNSGVFAFGDGDLRIIQQGIQYDPADMKSFVIPHPVDGDRWLVHGCTESPWAGVEYWGEAEIRGGSVVVPLPDYFEALTEEHNRNVQVTPVGEPCMVAASPIADGRFEIRCSGPDGTRVNWLVKAVRHAPFEVEPHRDDVVVSGFGPYRYLARNRARS